MFLKRFTPLQGWRAFIGEVAIIVLGVLIALAAQNIVEEWTWRDEVVQSRQQLLGEVADDFNYGAERLTVQPCLDAQLDRLADRAADPAPLLKPTPPIDSTLGRIAFRQPSRPYQTIVWNSVVGDGIAAHYPYDERQLLSNNYTQVRDLTEWRMRADEDGDRLNLFLHPVALDPTLRAHLIEQTAALKSSGHRMTAVAGQTMSMFWQLGLAPTEAVVDRYLANSGTLKYCREMHLPLGDWRALLMAQKKLDLTNNRRLVRYLAKRGR